MGTFSRITFHTSRRKAYIRGVQITVDAIFRLHSRGYSREDILREYPCLDIEDIEEALSFASYWYQGQERPSLLTAGYVFNPNVKH
ncbi:MAG: DUF433 domain-containing protein [Deltaproteobacteria bacterium]|nr:DUF433 domain-containing protein [Deltaproteobacteria bacterium]